MKINKLLQDLSENVSQMTGYKVMRFKDGAFISGADSRQVYRPGELLQNTWLSLDKDYVLRHYVVHDENALLTLKFNAQDILKGDPTDKETELYVRSAEVADWEVVEGD